MTLETDFLTTAADKLAENVDRIQACLVELSPQSLWARDSENENSVGNLLLHLDGNVRQWILSGVGARPGTRDRPGEFSARTGANASALLARLQVTVGEAVDLIRTLPHGRLAEEVAIQGYDTTVLSAIFHVVEHFSGHTYQVILLTKRFTGRDLGFYGYLNKTGQRETGREASAPPVEE
ncbi:MAG: DUF1572 family protein [Acidobacteriota bacterium]